MSQENNKPTPLPLPTQEESSASEASDAATAPSSPQPTLGQTALYGESAPPGDDTQATPSPRRRSPLPPADTMVLKVDDIIADAENASAVPETTAQMLPPKPLPPLEFDDTEKIQLSSPEPSTIDRIRGRDPKDNDPTNPTLEALPPSFQGTQELDLDDMVEEDMVEEDDAAATNPETVAADPKATTSSFGESLQTPKTTPPFPNPTTTTPQHHTPPFGSTTVASAPLAAQAPTVVTRSPRTTKPLFADLFQEAGVDTSHYQPDATVNEAPPTLARKVTPPLGRQLDGDWEEGQPPPTLVVRKSVSHREGESFPPSALYPSITPPPTSGSSSEKFSAPMPRSHPPTDPYGIDDVIPRKVKRKKKRTTDSDEAIEVRLNDLTDIERDNPIPTHNDNDSQAPYRPSRPTSLAAQRMELQTPDIASREIPAPSEPPETSAPSESPEIPAPPESTDTRKETLAWEASVPEEVVSPLPSSSTPTEENDASAAPSSPQDAKETSPLEPKATSDDAPPETQDIYSSAKGLFPSSPSLEASSPPSVASPAAPAVASPAAPAPEHSDSAPELAPERSPTHTRAPRPAPSPNLLWLMLALGVGLILVALFLLR